MGQPLKSCHKCGARALVSLSTDGNGEEHWQIVCSCEGCRCKPINYRTNNMRSRAAAVRTWNNRRAVGKG